MFIPSIWLTFSSCLSEVISMTCGIDNSPVEHVNRGIAKIETYPWLGFLYYPYRNKRYTTGVVLVTRQIALAAAIEIDKLPKNNFRARARVVVGHNCTGPAVGVRDYTYHPDYSKDTYSTLAIIQLETDHATVGLRPICPPPTHLKEQHFFAMVLSDNCKRSKMRIYKMKYVSSEQCRTFYRRSGLDVDTLWPSYTTCAKSTTGGHCVWQSGAILVVKLGKRWRLLGFGVYGPGCKAPARFLDYGKYHEWVQRSIERIGKPSITTLADNHIVMRRTKSSVQRFGPCDAEETQREIYTDEIHASPIYKGCMKYNVSIVADVEYSCIVFKADARNCPGVPKIRLRRWCSAAVGMMCYGLENIDISFFVEITFKRSVHLRVMAYGKAVKKVISPINAYLYLNRSNRYRKSNETYEYIYPEIMSYNKTKEAYKPSLKDPKYIAYGKN